MESLAEQVAHVRKRPGMYFGGTGPNALRHMALEVVSNSFDLVLAGQASRIDVSIDENGAITVDDDGPGLGAGDPSLATLTSRFLARHDSPTADGHWPHVHLSVGTGLAPLCAVSERVTVEARRTDGTFRQTFVRGFETGEVRRTAAAEPGQTGTTVEIVPDPEIFGDQRIDLDSLAEHVELLALLEPGLVTSLTTPGRGREDFGPSADVTTLFARRFRSERSRLEPAEPMLLTARGEDFAIDVAMAWANHRYKTTVESYGNYRPIHEPGWERDGVEEGLREVFGPGPIRDQHRGLMAGLRMVLHVRLLDPKFPGPTLSRLASPEVTWVVADVIAAQLPTHLAEHPDLAASLRQRTNTRTHRPNDD
ncbi:MAG: hypothetical protein ACTHN0_08000 [Aquihabitans sp.]